MKKISLLSLFAAIALMFASCDKIADDQFVIYAGANGTWMDSHANIPAVQRAFVEKYTGVRCVNCPTADEVLHASAEKYGDNLVVVAIHAPNNFGKPLKKDQDLRTEKGSTWFNTFFSTSEPLPVALLMRNIDNKITPTQSFDDQIDQVLGTAPKVSMMVASVHDGNGYSADVDIRFEQNVSDELTLTVLLIEDKIYTHQERLGVGEIEDYEQNHCLRNIITDAWGIDVDADGKQGTQRSVRLNLGKLVVDNEGQLDLNPENCHIVAFIANKATKQILNAASCELINE